MRISVFVYTFAKATVLSLHPDRSYALVCSPANLVHLALQSGIRQIRFDWFSISSDATVNTLTVTISTSAEALLICSDDLQTRLPLSTRIRPHRGSDMQRSSQHQSTAAACSSCGECAMHSVRSCRSDHHFIKLM